MNVNDFVGLPYREGARGPDAYDCYGIVAAVLRAARGVELPDWYQDREGPQGAARAIDAALTGEVQSGRAEKTAAPEDYDIAVVTSTVRAHHIGIVVQGGVLHAARAFGATWHPLPRFLMMYPRAEFYRWHR
jgi:cell wall-associated NlpC family hydrolase